MNDYDQTIDDLRTGINRLLLQFLLSGGDYRHFRVGTIISHTKFNSVADLIDFIIDDVLKAMKTKEYSSWCQLAQNQGQELSQELLKFVVGRKLDFDDVDWNNILEHVRAPVMRYFPGIYALHVEDRTYIHDLDTLIVKTYQLLYKSAERNL
jgi:hypothetical protein